MKVTYDAKKAASSRYLAQPGSSLPNAPPADECASRLKDAGGDEDDEDEVDGASELKFGLSTKTLASRPLLLLLRLPSCFLS